MSENATVTSDKEVVAENSSLTLTCYKPRAFYPIFLEKQIFRDLYYWHVPAILIAVIGGSQREVCQFHDIHTDTPTSRLYPGWGQMAA
ncbi:hypothetical protein DPMN_066395 [Dreissena polymorpha]|uniref:Uncharacterized protein n=1 Tax=Dreissena polymorpha TaxID=45954 RepID=A0A9D3YTE7_DREPO|nr:hypothetical protein DPMN_066395 [Dreissena polymorpha]